MNQWIKKIYKFIWILMLIHLAGWFLSSTSMTISFRQWFMDNIWDRLGVIQLFLQSLMNSKPVQILWGVSGKYGLLIMIVLTVFHKWRTHYRKPRVNRVTSRLRQLSNIFEDGFDDYQEPSMILEVISNPKQNVATLFWVFNLSYDHVIKLGEELQEALPVGEREELLDLQIEVKGKDALVKLGEDVKLLHKGDFINLSREEKWRLSEKEPAFTIKVV